MYSFHCIRCCKCTKAEPKACKMYYHDYYHDDFYRRCYSLRKSFVWEGPHTLKHEWGIVSIFVITLSSLVWENRQNFLPPAVPLSRSEGHKPNRNENNSCGFCPRFATISLCQTPKVINPSVMRSTAVVSASLCHFLTLPDSKGHKPKREENNVFGVTH